jgi:hypothetical protein
MDDPIKAKIQELCPDVMEFSTPKFKWKSFLKKFPPAEFDYSEKHKDMLEVITDIEWHAYQVGYNLAIKGKRPITLAVVLRAIASSKKAINALGGFMPEDQKKMNITKIIAYWNLTKDNYDDQTEETKGLIGQLINA